MKRRDVLKTALTAFAAGCPSHLLAGETVTDYDAEVRRVWRPIDSGGGLREIVRAGTLAANSHNTQPWRFALGDGRIAIEPDLSRRCPAVDPDDHHLFVSLGCAVENMIHAAAAMGLKADVAFEPAGDGRIILSLESAPALASPLVTAISERQCTRAPYDGRTIPVDELNLLLAESTRDGVECLALTARPQIESVLDYVVRGNTAQMRDKAFMAELTSWLRFDDAQALKLRDGLAARASGNPAVPAWLARWLLPLVFTEASENDKYATQIRSSPAIVVFSSAGNDRANWISAGRACQRFALRATAAGLKYAFVNQPVEVVDLRAQFGSFLGLKTRRPDLVVRLGYGTALPRSLRRPLDSVVVAL